MPAVAICQAASLPARPPPMTWIGGAVRDMARAKVGDFGARLNRRRVPAAIALVKPKQSLAEARRRARFLKLGE
jgi:hypothetical protein